MIRTASIPEAPPLPGVLFAEDFDEPPRRPAPPAPPPEPEEIEPVYSLADLERAHADGVLAGRAEAQSDQARALANAIAAIGAQLQDAGPAAARVAEAAAEALAQMLLAMLSAALPTLCRRHGEAEARAVMAAVLPALSGLPRVHVRAHPSIMDGLAAELRSLAPEVAEVAVLSASDTMLPGDIRLSWQDGSAVRDTAGLLAEIDGILGEIGLRDAVPGTSSEASRPTDVHTPARAKDPADVE